MSADAPCPAQRPSPLGPRALRQLYERQQPRVYRRALRLLHNPSDAEEATQEVFVRAFRAISGFEQQSEIGTWLHRITTNYCLNLLRDRRRRAELDEGHELTPIGPAPSDELTLLHRLLAAADEQQARAVLHVHLDGLTHDEAAQRLGVSRRTVGKLIERFRAWALDDRSLDDRGSDDRSLDERSLDDDAPDSLAA
jgi:RNA polymerase sigma-70 factor (ECF subfamily)